MPRWRRAPGTPRDAFAARRAATAERLAALDDGEDLFIGDEATGFLAAPATVDALARLYARHPDATLVAGATDVGLWITKQLRALPKIILLGRVAGLAEMRETERGFISAQASPCARAEPAMAAIDPDLVELLRRFGGKQVRAVGTLGGNIANGSPIGDSMPALIALGTTLHLRRGEATRSHAARGLLHRLRQAGPGGRRVRDRDRRAAPRGRPGLPLLQDLQTLRSGHFRRPGRVQVHRGDGPHHARARRLRRHGGHAEAGRRHGSGPQGLRLEDPRRLGRRLRGAGVGLPAHRRHAGQRPLPAGDGAGAAAARPCTRRAARRAPRPGSWGCGRRRRSVPPEPASSGADRARRRQRRSVGRALAHDSAARARPGHGALHRRRSRAGGAGACRARLCRAWPRAAGSRRSTSMRSGPRRASWRC